MLAFYFLTKIFNLSVWTCRLLYLYLQYGKFNYSSTTAATSPAKRCMGLLCLVYKYIKVLNPIRKFGVFFISGCSTDGYMDLFWKQAFAGSNPVTPTKSEL